MILFSYFEIPENIHTSPMIFAKLPPPLFPLEIPIKLCTFLSIFWPYRTPQPQEIPIPSVGEVWIFPGTEHYFFLNFNARVDGDFTLVILLNIKTVTLGVT